jgi:hypothetical protein
VARSLDTGESLAPVTAAIRYATMSCCHYGTDKMALA